MGDILRLMAGYSPSRSGEADAVRYGTGGDDEMLVDVPCGSLLSLLDVSRRGGS